MKRIFQRCIFVALFILFLAPNGYALPIFAGEQIIFSRGLGGYDIPIESRYRYKAAMCFSTSALRDFGNVQVMNIIDSKYRHAQCQLVAAPVSEPTSMLLLGTGLIGLAGIGRRKLKATAITKEPVTLNRSF